MPGAWHDLCALFRPQWCFNLRFSEATAFNNLGESTAGDYQDCRAPSMLLMAEPPWGPTCPDQSATPIGSRSDAVLCYKKKKKRRHASESLYYSF